jgi:uncharacterized protein YaaN involved in tellurite resistance
MTISKRRHAEIAGQAMKFVAELMLIEPLSPAFDHKLEAIAALGRDAIAQLAARTSGGLAQVAPPPTHGIAQAIAALRDLAASLEPLRDGNLGGGAGSARRWGLLPAKPDPKAYFRRYHAAQGQIAAALEALTRERDALLRANVAVEAEAAALAPLLAALEEQAVFAEEAALTLAARAEQIAPRDPARARRLTADALACVQGRARDIAEARALAQQSAMLRAMVGDTNARLIAGIEQATATMLMVLRTAVEAARLLAQQELVLEGIAGLGQAARNLIAEDGAPAEPDRAAALQAAFVRLYDALDRLDSERATVPARIGGSAA